MSGVAAFSGLAAVLLVGSFLYLKRQERRCRLVAEPGTLGTAIDASSLTREIQQLRGNDYTLRRPPIGRRFHTKLLNDVRKAIVQESFFSHLPSEEPNKKTKTGGGAL